MADVATPARIWDDSRRVSRAACDGEVLLTEVEEPAPGRTLSDFWQNAKTGFFRFGLIPGKNAKTAAPADTTG